MKAKDDKNIDFTKKNKEKEEKEPEVRQTGSLRERLARVKKTRWIRFGIVSLIFFAWVAWLSTANPPIWLHGWWVLIFWFLLADIYLTQYIPWNWWKFSEKKWVKTVMSWVDAIVYALVLVYFLFLFVGQNYQIPSSSLEKSLLVGDYLWVNKMVYGPRVPQTPLHFPLAQNELPVFNCKSYIEHPQWDYHRLKGWRNVERGDIVVFNFPAGDTVAKKMPNPDYYTLTYLYGRDAVFNNPEEFGDIVWRPVDRRDAYVKRCLGLPGETLEIKNGTVIVDGVALPEPENLQFSYWIKTRNNAVIPDDDFDALGVSIDDRGNMMVDSLNNRYYVMPLTKKMYYSAKKLGWCEEINRLNAGPDDRLLSYPIGLDLGWTHIDYGPIWIPQKGKSVDLTVEKNVLLYRRCIETYEGNEFDVKNGKVLINGKEAMSYTFKMDYYWMMGDNRDNSLDSRYWGFVPEDHIIGTPMFVIVSFDKDKPFFHDGVRWSRSFSSANPDKKSFKR